MSWIVFGKVLETVGAAALAYVGIRAACIELFIGRRLRSRETTKNEDLQALGKELNSLLERRREQFGFWEALWVSFGTVLVTAGCLAYLYGLLSAPH